VIAILDSNSNPEGIAHPVPGNDDAIRSINLYCDSFSAYILAGLEDGLTRAGVDIGAQEAFGEEETVKRKNLPPKGKKNFPGKDHKRSQDDKGDKKSSFQNKPKGE